MTRLMVLFLMTLLSWQAGAASLIASVDRNQLTLGETVELALEVQDRTLFGKPDLEPLNELFEVVATRQVNQLATVRGETRAVTRWLVTLQPRQTGYVVVPPLSLGDARSEPVTLRVLESAPRDEVAQLAPVFIDASLDQDSVYVQAQVTLTLRIYHSVSLYDDSTLSPLQMDDALVERLGDPRTYEKNINGVRHGVIEVRYALFPQKSGELTVPSQLFSATTVAAASDGHSLFGARPGRATQVKSPSIPLTVRPKPAEYPADAPWLPARSLSLVEAWTPEPENARMGDSLTRSLLIRAEGLSGNQLPVITPPVPAGIRRYPDQPKLANEVTATGLTGSREQREALVPSQPGAIEVPGYELVWWNTLEDRLERIELPSRQIQVADNPELRQPPIQQVEALPLAEQPALWPWQLSTALLACTSLIGFGLWWRARRQPAVQRSAPAGPSPRSLLDDLRRACLANDSQATRQALDAWARQQPETLADMAARFVPLSDALDGLNGALYSETGQHWQGSALWQAIQALPPLGGNAGEQEPQALPPLYPR